MKRFEYVALAALTTSLISFGLPAAAADCLTLNQVGDHHVVDDTHVIFATTFDGDYEFTVTEGCDFKFSDDIGFDTFSGFQVCTGDTMRSYERNIGQTGFCSITAIKKH